MTNFEYQRHPVQSGEWESLAEELSELDVDAKITMREKQTTEEPPADIRKNIEGTVEYMDTYAKIWVDSFGTDVFDVVSESVSGGLVKRYNLEDHTVICVYGVGITQTI